MSGKQMTRDEAIARLCLCPNCGTWRTDPDCDRCWINNHACPPTQAQAAAYLARAVELGREAAVVRAKLAGLFQETAAGAARRRA